MFDRHKYEVMLLPLTALVFAVSAWIIMENRAFAIAIGGANPFGFGVKWVHLAAFVGAILGNYVGLRIDFIRLARSQVVSRPVPSSEKNMLTYIRVFSVLVLFALIGAVLFAQLDREQVGIELVGILLGAVISLLVVDLAVAPISSQLKDQEYSARSKENVCNEISRELGNFYTVVVHQVLANVDNAQDEGKYFNRNILTNFVRDLTTTLENTRILGVDERAEELLKRYSVEVIGGLEDSSIFTLLHFLDLYGWGENTGSRKVQTLIREIEDNTFRETFADLEARTLRLFKELECIEPKEISNERLDTIARIFEGIARLIQVASTRFGRAAPEISIDRLPKLTLPSRLPVSQIDVEL